MNLRLPALIFSTSVLATAPLPVSAQLMDDLRKGLEIYQQVQDLQRSNKDDKNRDKDRDREREREKQRERETDDSGSDNRSRTQQSLRRTQSPQPQSTRATAGASGLSRRVVGNWQRSSRTRRVQPEREFFSGGRYEFREGDRIVERGRWQAADGETLVLRPEDGRSPSRLVVPRVDRDTMQMLFEIDWENDAQPETWKRVVNQGNDDEQEYRPLPGPGNGNPRPVGSEGLEDGFYRSPENVTVEVREGWVRVVSPAGRQAPQWQEPGILALRPSGNNRVRFVHQGIEQIAVKTPIRR